MTRRSLVRFRIGWTAFVVAAISAPYFFNWLSTPPGWHYTWILPPYPEDSYAYMAWAEQAARGALLFKLKYTALPHAPFLFHPFFLLCGWLGALFSCEIGIVFWIMKMIGAALLLVVFYRYIDYLGLKPVESITASVLLGVSSGFGGIAVFLGLTSESNIIPADLVMPEMSTFTSLLWNPLFPFSLTLLLLSIYWQDRGTREERRVDAWLAGLAAGVLALIHPYALPLLFSWSLIVAVVRRRKKAASFLIRYFVAAAPFALYVAGLSLFDPLVARHSGAGEMRSLAPAAYLLGYGVPLLICVAGILVGRGALLKRYWQIGVWFLLSLGLSYSPLWFQRKMIFGAHIPLCIFAAIAFVFLLSRWTRDNARVAVLVGATAVSLPFLIATPIYLLATEESEVRNNEDGAYFLSADTMEALRFLKKRSRPNDVIFGGLTTSRAIPAFAGNTVVWGHWAMSVDLKERENWMEDLFGAQADLQSEERSRRFWDNDIRFIFADGEIKQSMEEYPAAWRMILEEADKIYQNSSVVIYRRRSG